MEVYIEKVNQKLLDEYRATKEALINERRKALFESLNNQECPEIAEFEVIESTPLNNRQEEQAGFQPLPWQPFDIEEPPKTDEPIVFGMWCERYLNFIGMPSFHITGYSGA